MFLTTVINKLFFVQEKREKKKKKRGNSEYQTKQVEVVDRHMSDQAATHDPPDRDITRMKNTIEFVNRSEHAPWLKRQSRYLSRLELPALPSISFLILPKYPHLFDYYNFKNNLLFNIMRTMKRKNI